MAEPEEDVDDFEEEGEDPGPERKVFRRWGEQLSGLLDPEATLRRGQRIATGVTQATKDAIVNSVSSEVRNFLDKMDIADLLQQVISGLTVDVNMQVKFSREGDGPAQPEITERETKVRTGRNVDREDDDPEEKA